MLLLGFPESAKLTSDIANRRDCAHAQIEIHRFPDGESRVRLPAELPQNVVLCRSLDQPNDKLVELMLAARCARDLGARHITLIAPYLCYMRQDMAFNPGEAVSQQIVGAFLASLVDTLITADPHLHRVATLEDAVPASSAHTISAAVRMGEFLKSRGVKPLLLGPDEESMQWVRVVADIAGLDFVVATKTRLGDRDVRVALPAGDYSGRELVLIDDVASSGHTLIEAAGALFAAGAARVDVLITHALFAADALGKLRAVGVRQIWSSDSIPHSTNAFSLAEDFSEALERV
ncbi:ribose-phosphate diphosphokinase [Congregibacter variabilis]|uniref:Ribose-phosphate diphosphokinase n=1 Tax=Congregibacter variabilis TaxID=3081200 RepID=A0ABZ0I2N3_9GAMM|nr:ribose-phosphate diphosphokinase [Congregibacter sp. IMCC43200]